MRIPIEMQQLGPDVGVGVIIEWLKHVGDRVEQGEELVEVEIEKATVDMRALNTGLLVEITHGPGDEVPVGETIGYLETTGA